MFRNIYHISQAGNNHPQPLPSTCKLSLDDFSHVAFSSLSKIGAEGKARVSKSTRASTFAC